MRVIAPRVPSFGELYQAIQALPRGVTGEILEPGTIRTMGRPGASHRFAARRLLDSLARFDTVRRGSGWWFEQEAEVRLGGDLLAVPDIAGWRAVEAPPSFIAANPIVVAPDWCCEFLSPTTARDDRNIKLPLYARSGIGWVWLVDPEPRVVEVFESRASSPALVATARGGEKVRLPPFDAEMDLAQWWFPAPAGIG